MSQVDFHILSSQDPQRALHHACRFINKAYRQGHRLHVRVADEANAQKLDKLLWSFSDLAFIPHGLEVGGEEASVPVNISIMGGSQETNVILVNLSSTMPDNYQHHQRVIEIVAGDDAATSAARDRYRRYRDAGDTLQTHKIET